MPGRTAREAESNFAEFFRESLSVLTNAYLLAHNDKNQRILLYEPPVKLQRKNGDPLYMSIVQTFTVVQNDAGEYKATTSQYSYSVLSRDNNQYRPIVEFHWHPLETRNLKWPHMHVIANTHEGSLSRIHFPTARISIEDFIRLLLRDFDVKARLPYDQLKQILTKNKNAFVASARWLYYKPLI